MNGRRPVVALVAALLGAAITGSGSAAAAPASSPADWAASCSADKLGLDQVTLGLAPAPLSTAPDTNPDGSPVRITPDSRGRFTPVVMVHGWTSRDTHDNARSGTFSHLIDLTSNRLGPTPRATTRSLIGQLQRIPGVAVFTYDYRDYAARWVDDAHLGPGLGKVIDCLYQASGEKVIVVGHSMGGLVARYAATHPDRSERISTIVTFGAPQTGSVAALLTATVVDHSAGPVLATLRLILSACGKLTSNQIETGTLCDQLPAPVAAFSSDAGIALRYGSSQLRALGQVPNKITVDALAGGITLHVPRSGWFAKAWDTTTVDVGEERLGPA